MLAEGRNPSAEKKRAALAASIGAGNTFKAVAEAFIAKREREGSAAATVAKARWHLDKLNKLHTRPIAEIEAFELLGGAAGDGEAGELGGRKAGARLRQPRVSVWGRHRELQA